MPWISIKLWFTTFTILSFRVILADALPSGHIANSARLVSVVVAVAAPAALTGRSVAVTAGLTRLAKLTLGPILTLVTSSHASFTLGMIVASTVDGTICTRPT